MNSKNLHHTVHRVEAGSTHINYSHTHTHRANLESPIRQKNAFFWTMEEVGVLKEPIQTHIKHATFTYSRKAHSLGRTQARKPHFTPESAVHQDVVIRDFHQ